MPLSRRRSRAPSWCRSARPSVRSPNAPCTKSRKNKANGAAAGRSTCDEADHHRRCRWSRIPTMSTRAWVLGAVLVVAGCTCRSRTETLRRDDDSKSSTKPLDPQAERDRFVLVGHDLVDLDTKGVVATIEARSNSVVIDGDS